MNDPLPTDDAVVERDEVDAALFWHEHKKNILLGALAFVVVVGGSILWYASSTLTAEAARAALADAKDIPQFEAIITKYGGAMPAADALLLVAAANRDAGKLDESTAAFQKFQTSFPNHPLAGGALLGVGQNLDAAGNSQEAVTTYQLVMEKYPKSYAAPFAGYAQAEILLRDFRRDEARVILDSLISQFPESTVARLAAAQVARLGKN
ncbi:MAG: tetratricopeptide repeat protein [Terrimicrobiaceae bacterium]